METAQHQITVIQRNLCHDQQFTRRGEDACGNNRVVGQFVIENDVDIVGCPHLAMLTAARGAGDSGLSLHCTPKPDR